MKRLFNALSDENETVIKRARLLISPLSPTIEINTDEDEIILNELDSQSEHDDDDIEIVHENLNSTCQQIDNRIIIISDSDSDDDHQDINVTDDIPSNTINSLNVETVEIEENNPELIDLTNDETNSISYSLNQIDSDQCPICLETLSDLQYTGVYLLITQCHHVLCTLCSNQLLSTSSRCPLCRQNISSTTLMPYCILT